MATEGLSKNSISFDASEDTQIDDILLKPYNYIENVPYDTKQLTHDFLLWLNKTLKIDEGKLKIIEEIVLMLGNAHLLIDDIADNSALRRGVPATHTIYGIPTTLNTANYVLCLSLNKCDELNSPEATNIWIEATLDILRGQGMEIYWRDNYICPTEEEYFRMGMQKSGTIFLMIAKLMQLFSENKFDFSKFSALCGTYIQILEDYTNIGSDKFTDKKGYCEDLTEGKFGFPILHGIRKDPNDQQIMQILRQRTKDDDLKRYCVSLLHERGSFEYTRIKLDEIYNELMEEVEKLDPNLDVQELLEKTSLSPIY